MRPMSLPIHRQDEAMGAPAAAECCRYCLVPVSFDTTTSRVSLPDGTSISISERILLSAEEAEEIRPGITHSKTVSHLTSLLTFRQDHDQDEEATDDVLAPPLVSPESEVDANAKQTARSFRDLSGPKKSLFRSSSESNNLIAGSKVLGVEVVETPPGGKIQCIDLCDSSDDDKDNEESARVPRRLCANRSRSKEKRYGGGAMCPKKTIKRKARYTLSAPGFSSDEDGHESDSTFEGSEEAAAAAQSEEEDSFGPVLRPLSIRRARLKYDKEREGSSEDSGDDDDADEEYHDDEDGDDEEDEDDDDEDEDDDDEDDEEEQAGLTGDDNSSSDAIDVQLFCSWCGEHHNKDDFSLQQQVNNNDEGRFCLLHHNVGYQTKYEGTSSVRKFSSQLDMIGEKYKDVGSDDDIIGDSDTCMSDEDDEEEVEEENNKIDHRGKIPKASPMRRIKRKAEDLLDEESDSDEDGFGEEENERLHTQPPHILQDEDDEEGIEKGRNGGQAKHRRRIIYDD